MTTREVSVGWHRGTPRGNKSRREGMGLVLTPRQGTLGSEDGLAYFPTSGVSSCMFPVSPGRPRPPTYLRRNDRKRPFSRVGLNQMCYTV